MNVMIRIDDAELGSEIIKSSIKYEMYAERNPELKEMLETCKKLTV